MKSLGALGTHYEQPVTTLADLLLVTRTDGQRFGFSALPHDLYYDGVTYIASYIGYVASAITQSSDLAVDNLDITFVPSDVVTEADLLAGKWDGATIRITRINYNDITMGADILAEGTLGQIAFGNGQYTAEYRSKTQRLQTNIGRTVQKDCDADFGDARCKKPLGPLTVTGTITSVTSVLVFADSGRGEAAAFYDLGQITFTSGSNNGFAREIKTHATGGVFTLQEGAPYLPAVGDTYSLHPGCAKSLAACQAYANVVNHRGHPHLIGIDALIRSGGGV